MDCCEERPKPKITSIEGGLTEIAMNRVDAWRMIQRRAAEPGMKGSIGCHTFRATGITAYLEAGGTLENAQGPRTTKLYDRTGDGDHARRGRTHYHLNPIAPASPSFGHLVLAMCLLTSPRFSMQHPNLEPARRRRAARRRSDARPRPGITIRVRDCAD
jgi:hypothetical protein